MSKIFLHIPSQEWWESKIVVGVVVSITTFVVAQIYHGFKNKKIQQRNARLSSCVERYNELLDACQALHEAVCNHQRGNIKSCRTSAMNIDALMEKEYQCYKILISYFPENEKKSLNSARLKWINELFSKNLGLIKNKSQPLTSECLKEVISAYFEFRQYMEQQLQNFKEGDSKITKPQT